MKKLVPLLSVAFLFSATAVQAQIPVVQTAVDANVSATVDVQATSSEKNQKDNKDEKNQKEVRGNSEAHANVNAGGKHATTSTSNTTDGKSNAESHRSAVATFVQSLLSVADRDGGIGTEVRAVAQSQNDSASTTAEAMAKVESRSKVLTFLFGTDWKNVGVVRSEIAKGSADIQKLENTLDATTSASVRTEIEANIDLLKEEQNKLAEFVTENENRFSVFGWFTKLFVNANA